MMDEATLMQLVTMLKLEVKQDLIVQALVDSQLLSQKEVDEAVKIALDEFTKQFAKVEEAQNKALVLKKTADQIKKDEDTKKLQDEILANLPLNKIGNA